jgi:hypothetical protein
MGRGTVPLPTGLGLRRGSDLEMTGMLRFGCSGAPELHAD